MLILMTLKKQLRLIIKVKKTFWINFLFLCYHIALLILNLHMLFSFSKWQWYHESKLKYWFPNLLHLGFLQSLLKVFYSFILFLINIVMFKYSFIIYIILSYSFLFLYFQWSLLKKSLKQHQGTSWLLHRSIPIYLFKLTTPEYIYLNTLFFWADKNKTSIRGRAWISSILLVFFLTLFHCRSWIILST
jgi:hypothetical protein